MRRRAGAGRLRRLAALLPLLWMTEGVRADEGVPALLQFAEQYRSASPPVSKPAERPRDKKEKQTSPASGTVPSVKREGDGPVLRRALKQRDAQLNRLQTALREQEKQLVALRKALKAAEALQKEQPRQASRDTAGKPADFAPLQQLVSQLRDAAKGTPDTQRSRELIEQARQQTEHRRAELADSQAQVRALKIQLGDLKKQVQGGVQGVSREQASRLALQGRLATLQSQLEEKNGALKTLQQQLRAAEERRGTLEEQLARLQKTQAGQRQQAEASQAEELAAREKALAELKAQLGSQERASQQQQGVVAQKDAELATLRAEKQALQKQYDTLQQQSSVADARLAKQEQALLRLQDDATALRERAKWLVKPENLKQPAGQQAYAAGSALGRDIIEMLDERKKWGVSADRQTVLAGVIDAFSGQYQLTTDVLTRALTESESVVNKAREKAVAAQQKKGETFVADFKKKKGVKQSASGFWYRVDYAGDTPIAEDAIVDVVVKETLTDGTLIQDMDLGGNVLSQPLSAYPPLFREAIGHLRNHGSLTMVVPPELAYGDVGYPPKVPPNATMVYELRVDGVKAATGGKSGSGRER